MNRQRDDEQYKTRRVTGQVQRDETENGDKREKQPRLSHIEFAGCDCHARKLYEQRRSYKPDHKEVALCKTRYL